MAARMKERYLNEITICFDAEVQLYNCYAST